eukprot:gene16294-22482_t
MACFANKAGCRSENSREKTAARLEGLEFGLKGLKLATIDALCGREPGATKEKKTSAAARTDQTGTSVGPSSPVAPKDDGGPEFGSWAYWFRSIGKELAVKLLAQAATMAVIFVILFFVGVTPWQLSESARLKVAQLHKDARGAAPQADIPYSEYAFDDDEFCIGGECSA